MTFARDCFCPRKFVQGESRTERLCKARAETKFTWIMPSRSQFSCKRVQSRTCSGYAERSRKCQEKVHLYEQNRTFTAQKQQGETQHPVKTTSISALFPQNPCTIQINALPLQHQNPPSLSTMLNRRQTESNVKLV